MPTITVELSLDQAIRQINHTITVVRAYKVAHPETTLPHTHDPGSILNAYREGDISFAQAVKELSCR